MPRKTRNYVPGMPVHVVQRGNNRQATFIQSDDYACYLQHLAQGLKRYDTALHAYCLMSNHVHLLMTPKYDDSISRTIQHLGRNYVLWFNKKYRRSGTLWEGRHKGKVIHNERYLLACYRYIEMNPVKAGIVATPAQYRWSSYTANAHGASSPLLTAHASYEALSNDNSQRQMQYRALFNEPLQQQVRDSTSNKDNDEGREMESGDDRYYVV